MSGGPHATDTRMGEKPVGWPVRSSAGAWQLPNDPATRLSLGLFAEERSLPAHALLPQHLDWIVGKDRIMTDEDCFFHVGLGDEQPVKRVLVMGGQILHR